MMNTRRTQRLRLGDCDQTCQMAFVMGRTAKRSATGAFNGEVQARCGFVPCLTALMVKFGVLLVGDLVLLTVHNGRSAFTCSRLGFLFLVFVILSFWWNLLPHFHWVGHEVTVLLDQTAQTPVITKFGRFILQVQRDGGAALRTSDLLASYVPSLALSQRTPSPEALAERLSTTTLSATMNAE